jgi:hypothetical protein
MRVKIVGGPRDGEIRDFDTSQHSLVLYDPIKAQDVLQSYGSDLPEIGPTITRTEYTPRYLQCSYPGGREPWRMVYLAPYDWTDVQAIEHQFKK